MVTKNREACARVRIDARSMVALECYGLFESGEKDGVAFADPHAETLRPLLIGRDMLLLRPATSDEAWSAINEISNELDELARHERDRERRRWYTQDSRALLALLDRITKATRMWE